MAKLSRIAISLGVLLSMFGVVAYALAVHQSNHGTCSQKTVTAEDFSELEQALQTSGNVEIQTYSDDEELPWQLNLDDGGSGYCSATHADIETSTGHNVHSRIWTYDSTRDLDLGWEELDPLRRADQQAKELRMEDYYRPYTFPLELQISSPNRAACTFGDRSACHLWGAQARFAQCHILVVTTVTTTESSNMRYEPPGLYRTTSNFSSPPSKPGARTSVAQKRIEPAATSAHGLEGVSQSALGVRGAALEYCVGRASTAQQRLGQIDLDIFETNQGLGLPQRPNDTLWAPQTTASF